MTEITPVLRRWWKSLSFCFALMQAWLMATLANGQRWRSSCVRRRNSSWSWSRSCRWVPPRLYLLYLEQHSGLLLKGLFKEGRELDNDHNVLDSHWYASSFFRWPAAGCRSWSRIGFRCRRSGSCCHGNRMPCERTPVPESSVRKPLPTPSRCQAKCGFNSKEENARKLERIHNVVDLPCCGLTGVLHHYPCTFTKGFLCFHSLRREGEYRPSRFTLLLPTASSPPGFSQKNIKKTCCDSHTSPFLFLYMTKKKPKPEGMFYIPVLLLLLL